MVNTEEALNTFREVLAEDAEHFFLEYCAQVQRGVSRERKL